ncbi:MAG: hypothetical protein KBC33_01755 [Candidatus Pacebacteria bacterium]|nr:hypothetical protein [Candidatus Paceibacterota bacterium]
MNNTANVSQMIQKLNEEIKKEAQELTSTMEELHATETRVAHLKADAPQKQKELDALKLEIPRKQKELDALKLEIPKIQKELDALKLELRNDESDIPKLRAHQQGLLHAKQKAQMDLTNAQKLLQSNVQKINMRPTR